MGPGIPNPMLWGSGDPLDELGKIERSLRARASASGHLVRLFSAGGNRKTFTLNDWVTWHGQTIYLLVADSVTPGTGGDWGLIQIASNGQFVFSTTANNTSFVSTRLLRDPGAKYNINVAIDTTQAALADRVKISINGELAAGTWSGAGIAQNADTYFMAARNHSMFRLYDGVNTSYSGGQSAARVVVDGQALPPTSFGQYHPRTGQWRPKTKAAIRAAVAAAGGVRNGWGVNGAFLPYDDTSSVTALGYDRSQSDTDTTGNNWTPNNISLTPGATYDSMQDTPTDVFCNWNPLVPGESIKSNGNLDAAGTARGTMAASSFPCQWEITANAAGVVGGVVSSTGTTSTVAIPSGSTYGFRLSGGTLEYTTNGSSWTGIATGLAGERLPYASGGSNTINCGQRPMAYSMSAGFKTLSTKNLPVIPPNMKPENEFVSVVDSGANIVSTLAAARAGWSSYVDILKNVGASESWAYRFSHDPGNEYSVAENAVSRAANRVVSGTSWLGQSIKISAASGTAAGVVNHTSGAVTTVSHGVGLTDRQMIFLFPRAGGTSVKVYHPELTAGNLIDLCNIAALTEAANTSITNVTSSSFQIGSATASGMYDYLVLSEKEGLFILGKYTATGVAGSGAPFLQAPGTPQSFWCMNRNTNYSTVFYDAALNPYNYCRYELETNRAMAMQAIQEIGYGVDFVSNGVKLLGYGNGLNASGTYIYAMRIAESFRYSNAR